MSITYDTTHQAECETVFEIFVTGVQPAPVSVGWAADSSSLSHPDSLRQCDPADSESVVTMTASRPGRSDGRPQARPGHPA